MTNDVAFEQSNTGANEESLRMVSASPVGNEPVSDEELRPHVLDGFIGQPRLKTKKQLFWLLRVTVPIPLNSSCWRGLRAWGKPRWP